MNKFLYTILIVAVMCFSAQTVEAGNPDRQGQAGAYELMLNPWGQSAGLHSLVAAHVRGVEAMRTNVAGLSHINQTEILLARTTYLQGTGMYLNAGGLAQRMGKSGVLGISIMAVDFGDILTTTTQLPEGVGGTFSPSFVNLGLAYAHLFENNVSVGATLRVVSESTANVSAIGVAIDAGVLYTTGPTDNIRLGISLRNVGTPMNFKGPGLDFEIVAPSGASQFTVAQKASSYELPSLLNIGGAYDFNFDIHKVTVVANFTSNSFSRDQIGGGLEYSFRDMFAVRAAYKYEIGYQVGDIDAAVYTGLAFGASLDVPMNKENESKFGINYAYRATNPWSGTHNIGIKIGL